MSADASSDAASKFARDLRLRHQALMTRTLAQAVAPAEVEAFVRDVIEAGARVPAGRERDRLRNMLFFWSTETAGRQTQAAADSLSRPSDVSAEPARALPDLKPYQGDGRAARTTLSADEPLRPSTLADRELSDAELAELVKTRTTLRIAALARQYAASSEAHRKGYLLSGDALEQARAVVDRDPDIAALVKESDQRARRDKWLVRAVIIVLAGLIGLAITLFISEKNAEADFERTKSKALEAQMTSIYKELRAALAGMDKGDPQLLRAFAKKYGDAVPNEQERIVAAPTDAAGSDASAVVGQLQLAVKALRAGDAKPLIALSREIAHPDARSSKLTEVEQAARASRSQPFGDSAARPPALAAPADANADHCEGWLWIGSDQNRKVSGAGALASLKPGDRVTVTAGDDVNLRADAPKGDYAMGKAIGLVAVGSEVRIAGAPIPYARPNGLTQYWARVVTARPFCTRVRIQYAGDQTDRVSGLRDALIGLGYVVPPPERLDANAKGLAQIRYRHRDDEAAAHAIASQLSQLTPGHKAEAERLKPDAGSGTVEVWIDLSLMR
jgi:hypothetical protein